MHTAAAGGIVVVVLLVGAGLFFVQAIPLLIAIAVIAGVIFLWARLGFWLGLATILVIAAASSFYWWPMVSPIIGRLMAQPSIDQAMKRAGYQPEFDYYMPTPAVVQLIREDLSRLPRDWSRPVGSDNPPILAANGDDLTRSEIGALMRILCDDFNVLTNGPAWAEDDKDLCSRSDYELGELSNQMTLVLAQLARDQFEQTLCERGDKTYCDEERPNPFGSSRVTPPGEP